MLAVLATGILQLCLFQPLQYHYHAVIQVIAEILVLVSQMPPSVTATTELEACLEQAVANSELVAKTKPVQVRFLTFYSRNTATASSIVLVFLLPYHTGVAMACHRRLCLCAKALTSLCCYWKVNSH